VALVIAGITAPAIQSLVHGPRTAASAAARALTESETGLAGEAAAGNTANAPALAAICMTVGPLAVGLTSLTGRVGAAASAAEVPAWAGMQLVAPGDEDGPAGSALWMRQLQHLQQQRGGVQALA
jgi:hypothetical protein